MCPTRHSRPEQAVQKVSPIIPNPLCSPQKGLQVRGKDTLLGYKNHAGLMPAAVPGRGSAGITNTVVKTLLSSPKPFLEALLSLGCSLFHEGKGAARPASPPLPAEAGACSIVLGLFDFRDQNLHSTVKPAITAEAACFPACQAVLWQRKKNIYAGLQNSRLFIARHLPCGPVPLFRLFAVFPLF